MKILQINSVYAKGSTGRIAKGIHDICAEKGIACQTAYSYSDNDIGYDDTVTISSWLDCHAHNRLARLTMLHGCFSRMHTLRFLRWVEKYAPDIIHFHNLHGNYVNIPLLFQYAKKHNVRVVWTLHDCWSMTGNCAHFDMVGCEKWVDGCNYCPQRHADSVTRFDNSKLMHKKKKKWFTSVLDMTLVTPSVWLADLVKKSYLKDYPVKVINNGIDLSVFGPTENDFKKKTGIEDKIMLLGVAFGWGTRKGLDVFVELSKRLPEQYQIVLVGTDERSEAGLPSNIISVRRTNSQTELAEIYSAADLFINPTREENFPTVNIESIACGTPVLTFQTGGSPEIIDDTCGAVVPKNDVDAMEKEILRICTERPYSAEACLKRAALYDMYERFGDYVKLYEEITAK